MQRPAVQRQLLGKLILPNNYVENMKHADIQKRKNQHVRG